MSARLPDLRLAHPATIADAHAAFAAHPDSRYIAGGTDLLVNMRRGIVDAQHLVDLSGIDELEALELSDDRATIGAGVKIARLAHDRQIAARYPALAAAAASIAAPNHRNVATVGGNLCLDTRCVYYNQSEWWRGANAYCLKKGGETCHVAPQGARCHAAFSGDLAPALMVLGAAVEIAGAQGRRRIPLPQLYVEDGRAHLALAPDELITTIRLPAAQTLSAYDKVRVRGAIDYPLAGVAVALRIEAGAIASLTVAITGTNSRPFLVDGLAAFVGRAVDDNVLSGIDKLVQHQVQPMRTTIVAAHYRRLSAAAVARRVVADLAARS